MTVKLLKTKKPQISHSDHLTEDEEELLQSISQNFFLFVSKFASSLVKFKSSYRNTQAGL